MHDSLYYTFNITPLGALTIKNLLILISVTSLIIGAIGGLYQLNIKRLLAFSAISHVGFLLLALAINNKVSLESFIFYLGQYTLTNLNIFLILITFGYLSSFSFNSKVLINSSTSSPLYNYQPLTNKIGSSDLNFITQLTGLFTNNPILTVSFSISLFSMAGIPPLLGFFAKQQVLLGSLSVGFIFITIVAIISSIISAYYYLKLIQVSTFSNNNLLSRLPNMVNNFLNKEGNTNLSALLVLKESVQPVPLKADLKEGPKLITDKINIFYFKPNLSAELKDWSAGQTGFFTSTQYGLNKFYPNFFIQSNTTSIKTNTNFISSAFITNNIHSYLISILTLTILFYTLKPSLLLNITNILASYSFNL